MATFNDAQSQRYSDLKQQIEDLYEERAKGAMLRSRARWIELGEQNTKYFYGLERRNFTNQCIYQLRENGEDVFDMEEIDAILHEFYRKLYSSNEADLESPEFQPFFDPAGIEKICEEDSDKMEACK